MKDSDSLDKYLNFERIRYRRKGYGIIFALLFTLAYFYLAPEITRAVYPKIYYGKDEVTFYILFVAAFHQLCFTLINLCFMVIYKLNWNFLERYKVNDRPWPWMEDSQKWYKMLTDTIKLLFVNQLVVLPLSLTIYYLQGSAPYNMDPNYEPSKFEIILQIVFFMLAEDFTFYFSHRFLHWDKIYSYIHKIHHKYTNTVSIASEYAHPLEFLVSNLLTTSSGSLLLGRRTHITTYAIWILLRVGETSDGHCGYEFSWSPYRLLPFSGSSDFHNYHHLNYKGNYGSLFTFWDRICGTVSPNYDKLIKMKEQLTEKTQKVN